LTKILQLQIFTPGMTVFPLYKKGGCDILDLNFGNEGERFSSASESRPAGARAEAEGKAARSGASGNGGPRPIQRIKWPDEQSNPASKVVPRNNAFRLCWVKAKRFFSG
jgi:hypothetical protein